MTLQIKNNGARETIQGLGSMSDMQPTSFRSLAPSISFPGQHKMQPCRPLSTAREVQEMCSMAGPQKHHSPGQRHRTAGLLITSVQNCLGGPR